MTLVGVLCAYNGDLTKALVPCVTSVAKKNPGHHAHGNGHCHANVKVYARLSNPLPTSNMATSDVKCKIFFLLKPSFFFKVCLVSRGNAGSCNFFVFLI